MKRRYIIVIALAWAFIGLFTLYLATDAKRLLNTQATYTSRLVNMGRTLYAENCANCHGSAGEGVIGPPLNRVAFRGEPSKLPETYELLVSTIEQGRPGTTDPHWVRLSNGAMASYTGMNAWTRAKGGPLNAQQTQAAATFIMLGEWHDVPQVIPPPILPAKADGSLDVPELYNRMPAGVGLSATTEQAAKELLRTKTCIQCHTVGRTGGQVGPNLTKVGSWGVDQAFLQAWVKNPPKVEHRAPEYWSNYGGPLQAAPPVKAWPTQMPLSHAENHAAVPGNRPNRPNTPNAPNTPAPNTPAPNANQISAAIPLGPTQMPVLALTNKEAATLASYLYSLK